MTEPLAIGSNYDDLIRFLRERAVSLGMTDEMIAEIGGFSSGYVGKLLGAKRVKSLAGLSFDLMFGALGVKFAILEDEVATAKIKNRIVPSVKSQRDLSGAKAPRMRVSSEIAKQILSDLGRKSGPLGHERRMQSTTPEQRSRYARKAAKARWKRTRNKPSMGTF